MGMKMPVLQKPPVILFIFILFLIMSSPLSGQEIKIGKEFDKLILQLINDGFEKEKIEQLFSSENVFFNP
ncbi:MAG: protein MltB, partial [Proteobacteria bacterium]|nr:protein MltB [Pseudomonadota bacterium]